MSEKTTDEEMLFEHDPKGAFAQFVAPMAGYGVTMASFFRPTVTEQYPREPAACHAPLPRTPPAQPLRRRPGKVRRLRAVRLGVPR